MALSYFRTSNELIQHNEILYNNYRKQISIKYIIDTISGFIKEVISHKITLLLKIL